jgi:DNA-binding HxlR family transcriptional regulator
MASRSYGQYCPIAKALDVLGDRWTLLVLRELLGGPRRYSDLRAELPGIATNLLSDRLRQLAAEGLVEQFEMPAPMARTLYRLTDAGWKYVPPVIGALARFGSGRLGPEPGRAITPLTGFLAGVLLGFDGRRARNTDEDYRAVIDGRVFDFGVRDGCLTAARGTPAAELRAHASDLAEGRRHWLRSVSNTRKYIRWSIPNRADSPAALAASRCQLSWTATSTVANGNNSTRLGPGPECSRM